MLTNDDKPTSAYKNYHDFHRLTQIKREPDSAPAPEPEPQAEAAWLRHASAETSLRTAAAGLHRALHAASLLHAAAAPLAADAPSSVWNRRTARTSHPQAMEVRALGAAEPGPLGIEILRVAAAQANVGTPFVRGASASAWQGVHEFTLRRGEQSYRGAVVLFPSDTYAAALRKFREAVAGASFGIIAMLQHDSAAQTIRLSLRSAVTGSEHAFDISDERGRLAELCGVRHPSQRAEDLLYRLDGQTPRRLPGNVFQLANGALEVRALDATDGRAVITVDVDRGQVADCMLQAIEAYNRFLSEVDTYSPPVRTWLSRFRSEHLSLPDYGIAQNEQDGSLTADRERLLARLAESGVRVDADIAGESGWSRRLLAASSRLQALSPMSLLQPELGADGLRPLYSSEAVPYQPPPWEGLLLNWRY